MEVFWDQVPATHSHRLSIDALELFSKEGEKPPKNNVQAMMADEDPVETKKSKARETAHRLFESQPKLREDIENAKKRKADSPKKSPPKKKPRTSEKGRKYVGRRVAKNFLRDPSVPGEYDVFFGTVMATEVDSEGTLWNIVYDDEDQEDYDEEDLNVGLMLYEEQKKLDPKNKK